MYRHLIYAFKRSRIDIVFWKINGLNYMAHETDRIYCYTRDFPMSKCDQYASSNLLRNSIDRFVRLPYKKVQNIRIKSKSTNWMKRFERNPPKKENKNEYAQSRFRIRIEWSIKTDQRKTYIQICYAAAIFIWCVWWNEASFHSYVAVAYSHTFVDQLW